MHNIDVIVCYNFIVILITQHNITSVVMWFLRVRHERVTSEGEKVGTALSGIYTEAETVVFRSSIWTNY